MDVPRFTRAELNAHLADGELEATFPRFAREVFAKELPGLHTFPTGGKDGAIDFVTEVPARAVGDFKFLSEDGVEPARGAWRVVAGHLSKHLKSSSGPSRGQAQYAPWYRTDNPIRAYHFCLSSRLKNLNQGDGLSDEIQRFFVDLAAVHPHLAHLADLSVHVHDWDDVERLLIEQPHLLLRWFPRTRPRGLVPLDETAGLTSFRAYLRSDKLPYYSRAEYRRRDPFFPNDFDEEVMLGRIDHRRVTGLLITGSGGVGKSRLSMELGRRAEGTGALVLRAVGRVAIDELTRLGERLNPETPCLVLIEYVETQTDFDALVDCINTLNDTYGLRIGYVATCRTSHYGTVAGLTRHVRVDLTPPSGTKEQQAERSFRKAAVEHILAHSIGVTEEALRVCRDSPVLAVFLAYLRDHGREPDLAELLHERDFGAWVARRIQASFGMRDIAQDLATLIAQLPFDDTIASVLPPESRALFDRLATDGWIERDDVAGDGTFIWSSIHDVLADQILLGYLRSIPATMDLFVRDLLRHAARGGTLPATLVSLQRIQTEPSLDAVDWAALLQGEVRRDPATWIPARLLLLRTSLLTTNASLTFLSAEFGRLWSGVDDDINFHSSLGYIARAEARELILEPQSRQDLARWIGYVAPRATKNNFVLTWGLRLGIEAVRGPALAWLQSRPSVFQTHYLLVAWLQSGLGPSEVEATTKRWLATWKVSFHASFVFRAWLDAEAKLDVVTEAIKDWLNYENNRLLPDARFVYRAWLNAEGDLDVVAEGVKGWLGHDNNRLLPEASYVYRAWLNAGGKLEIAAQGIRDWLGHENNSFLPEASFVYRAWLVAEGRLDVVAEAIEDWLGHESNRLLPEASYVYRAWLNADGKLEVVERAVKDWLGYEDNRLRPDAQFVYRAWLDAEGRLDVVAVAIKDWLGHEDNRLRPDAQFVYRSWLDADGKPDVVTQAIRDWLGHQKNRLLVAAQFVYRSWLNAKGKLDVVAGQIRDWLGYENNLLLPGASFVYRAWLDAGGKFGDVDKPIRDWLGHENNRLLPEASFVYRAWLDAGGDIASVEKPLAEWLALNESAEDSDYVFRAWLQAGGSFALIRRPVLEWVRTHSLERDAVYVLKYVAKQRILPDDVTLKILNWCANFANDHDAVWRLNSLSAHISADLFVEAVRASEAVLEPIFANSKLPSSTRWQVTTILGNLSTLEHLASHAAPSQLDSLLCRWVNHPQSFEADTRHAPHHQTRQFLARLLAAVESEATRTPVLSPLIGWVECWDEQVRISCNDLVTRLRELPHT